MDRAPQNVGASVGEPVHQPLQDGGPEALTPVGTVEGDLLHDEAGHAVSVLAQSRRNPGWSAVDRDVEQQARGRTLLKRVRLRRAWGRP
jgi:hypothetical protein